MKTEELNILGTIEEYNLNSLVFKYIEGWNNTHRIHSALNGLMLWEAFYEKSTKLAASPFLGVHDAEEVHYRGNQRRCYLSTVKQR